MTSAVVLNVLAVLAGLTLLAIGGEALVRGALGLARRLGVTPLVAGLVVVGFGTSSPELLVSVQAAMLGTPDIAVGNVLGSNIANVLLIVGVAALVAPLPALPRVLVRDGAVMVASAVLVGLLLATGRLGPVAGSVLLALLLGYLTYAYYSERRHASLAEVHAHEAEELQRVPAGFLAAVVVTGLGLIALVGGARLLVTGAVELARAMALSEALIGVTLVAVGTSLPELAVSLAAARRGHADVVVGNVLGSNIFNGLGILGVAALFGPLTPSWRLTAVDAWVAVASAVGVMIVLATGARVTRGEGALLLVAYAAYVGASGVLAG